MCPLANRQTPWQYTWFDFFKMYFIDNNWLYYLVFSLTYSVLSTHTYMCVFHFSSHLNKRNYLLWGLLYILLERNCSRQNYKVSSLQCELLTCLLSFLRCSFWRIVFDEPMALLPVALRQRLPSVSLNWWRIISQSDGLFWSRLLLRIFWHVEGGEKKSPSFRK